MQKVNALILFLCSCIFGGELVITSTPPNAEIVLNGIKTGRFTPDTFNLKIDSVSLSLLADSYNFEKREVYLADSTVTVNFTSLDTFEEVSIKGDELFGILQLAPAPLGMPYLINGIIEDRPVIALSEGSYHIQWNGGIQYKTIDTTVIIHPARITNLELVFALRYGKIDIIANPKVSKICIDSMIVGNGIVHRSFSAGKHIITASAPHYLTYNDTVILFPNQTYRDTIVLKKSPDSDGDGFNDTVDLCPEIRGIYDGCPTIQKRAEWRKIGKAFSFNFAAAPFTIEFAPISFVKRHATNDSLEEMVSLFNDGPKILNSLDGILFLNKLWISKGLFISSFDIGYNFVGSQYKKSWDISIGNNRYIIYDEYYDIVPTISSLTGSLQLGVQFHTDFVSFSVLTGYQLEKIYYDDFTEIDPIKNDTTLISYTENNSRWITTTRASLTFRNEPLFPKLYGEMSFTATSGKRTGWIGTNFGVIIPWWKKRQIDSPKN